MSPSKSRPQLDASFIRRPGQAAPVAAPVYARFDEPVYQAPTASPVVSAPEPVAVPVVTPAPKTHDSMPWLGGRPWTRKLGIRVDEDRVRRIKIVAAARGTTMEEMLVDAIDQYMDRHWADISREIR
jgi:hypothetical protein